MNVRDFMVTDVISVSPSQSIKDVMAVFVKKKIGGVPLVNEQGKLMGMVTDGDILRVIKPIDRRIQDYVSFITYIAEEDLDDRLSQIANKEIIKIAKTHGIVSVHPEDEMRKVIDLLSRHHFKKLPVIDESQRLVGVISRGDVIRHIQRMIMSRL